ncbi:MAG: AmmeMemoRadiSam system protein B [Patescibacteria group bacterium]
MKKAILIITSIILVAGTYWYFSKLPAIAPAGNKSANQEFIPVVVVPHFDDFSEKRKELLADVGKKYSPETAVVVSVDHFNAGASNITTTKKTWKLAGGEATPVEALVNQLADSKIAGLDEASFEKEHGITNVLADVTTNISKNFLPIIIKDGTSRAEVDKLADWLNDNCNDCQIIASVDFSHYQPNALAKIHDQYSIQALSGLDFDKIWQAETDSPQALYLAARIADKRSAKNFNLFYNGNSGAEAKNDDAETTSVVLGYYSDKQSQTLSQPSSSFVIAGDAMFDRNVWQRSKTAGFKSLFDNFGTRVFRGVDAPVLNLEGPVSEKSIPGIETGSMVFNFQPEIPSILKYINVGAVSLANNHTNNAGASGFVSTKKMLDQSGIKYFGLPTGYSEASVLRIAGEVPMTIIGIMTLENFDQAALEAKIKAEKAAGQFVIVYPHWGTEYAPKHSASQRQMAKEWIAAGANLIVGSHPHVTQDFEIIDGKPVVYSLGNFVFDQFFSEETQQGLILAGTITKEKITLTFLPTKEIKVKPQLMRGAEKASKIKSVLDINSEIGFKKLSSDTIELIK